MLTARFEVLGFGLRVCRFSGLGFGALGLRGFGFRSISEMKVLGAFCYCIVVTGPPPSPKKRALRHTNRTQASIKRNARAPTRGICANRKLACGFKDL